MTSNTDFSLQNRYLAPVDPRLRNSKEQIQNFLTSQFWKKVLEKKLVENVTFLKTLRERTMREHNLWQHLESDRILAKLHVDLPIWKEDVQLSIIISLVNVMNSL